MEKVRNVEMSSFPEIFLKTLHKYTDLTALNLPIDVYRIWGLGLKSMQDTIDTMFINEQISEYI